MLGKCGALAAQIHYISINFRPINGGSCQLLYSLHHEMSFVQYLQNLLSKIGGDHYSAAIHEATVTSA